MLGESHALLVEFPERKDVISTLLQSNLRFQELSKEYHELDNKIRDLELHDTPVSDVESKKLKSHRAYLKDTLYDMIENS